MRTMEIYRNGILAGILTEEHRQRYVLGMTTTISMIQANRESV